MFDKREGIKRGKKIDEKNWNGKNLRESFLVLWEGSNRSGDKVDNMIFKKKLSRNIIKVL